MTDFKSYFAILIVIRCMWLHLMLLQTKKHFYETIQDVPFKSLRMVSLSIFTRILKPTALYVAIFQNICFISVKSKDIFMGPYFWATLYIFSGRNGVQVSLFRILYKHLVVSFNKDVYIYMFYYIFPL